MTREELVGSLIEEGFPRREAEHEADIIQGSIEDDKMPTYDRLHRLERVCWDLKIQFKES
jgi:hypothetical protein